MKGGLQGLKVSQVSMVLIGLVCVAIFTVTWTKSSFLTSFIPTQSRFLQPYLGSREMLKETNNSVQTGMKQFDSHGSSGLELATERTNDENVTISDKGEIPSSVLERTGSDNHPGGKPRSKQEQIMQENPLTKKSSVEKEKTRNSTATTTGEKETPIVQERKGSDGLNRGNSKSRQENVVPEDPSIVDSSVDEPTRNLSAMTGKKDCNYAKGKWVYDDNWPLYSGSACKQWLSPMWACRLTQRTDFEYEKLRWQPKDCKMEAITGSKFLQRMLNKTLAFVGDSLGRQQFQSLMCMLTGGEESPDVLNVGYEYGLVKARGAKRPDGWVYRFPTTNTTVLFYWSASLSDLEPINASNPVTDIAMHLDRPPAFLRRYFHKFDILVLNTGHHWNKGKFNSNRWVMHIRRAPIPNTDKLVESTAAAKNFTLHSIVKWVNSQLPLFPGHKAFLRSLSPRHFFNGDWNTGGTCDNTTPLFGGKEVVQDNSSDPVAAMAVKGTEVKLLDITGLSQLRDEGHMSRYSLRATTPTVQDCLHWCLPGIPDTWNEVLFAQL